MRKQLLHILMGVALLPLTHRLSAQLTIQERYPNEEAVYTKVFCDIAFKFENGKWISTRRQSEELMFLTDNAVKMMSRGRIYHSSFNELKKWEAWVQTPESKKIKVFNTSTASSRQNAIFYDDVKATSFDYAGAVVGATRHMDYEILQTDLHLLSPHYFERYFPVLEQEVRITVPEDLKLKYLLKGLHTDKVVVTETAKRDKIIYTFRINNTDGERSYQNAPDNAYYSTHLILYIDQVRENGVWKNFLSSPAELYAHSYEFIRNTNKNVSDELRRMTDSIVANARTAEEKTKAIYRWVQSHIKYVAFEDGMEGFIPREANLVFTRRFGDCKDMASILTAMLNHAGVPAYFTWIGTRDIPYDYTDVPLPISDNHMIATAKIGDRYIFLDATDDGCIFGRPPYSIQGKQAMVSISDTVFRIVRVPVIAKEENQTLDSTFLRMEGKDAKGKIKVKMTGYEAASFLTNYHYRNEKEKEEYLKSRFGRASNKLRFTNWKVDAAETRDQVTVTSDFVLPDYVRTLDAEIFFNLNLFRWFEHQEIDYPKRKSPMEFPYLEKTSYTIQFDIPEGYKVSHLPAGESFKNDIWGFELKYGSDPSKVWMTYQNDTDQLLLQPNQFEKWNKVLEHLFPHYKETVALIKK